MGMVDTDSVAAGSGPSTSHVSIRREDASIKSKSVVSSHSGSHMIYSGNNLLTFSIACV